jgi:hypothetical protein
MEGEIKDCPFCGSESEYFKTGKFTTGHGETNDRIGVRCTGCPVVMQITDYTNYKHLDRLVNCIDAWNSRIKPN